VVALSSRGVSHYAEGHDTIHDWSVVVSCPSCGYGELRSFSHDCWKPPWEEEWDMEWTTQIPPEPLVLIRQGMAACPDAAASACECPTHVSLRKTRTRAENLRLGEKGARPDAHVALRDDGVPEFIYTPTA
jgi:hypothetical protein